MSIDKIRARVSRPGHAPSMGRATALLACVASLLASAESQAVIILPSPELQQSVLADSPLDLLQDSSSTDGSLMQVANSPPAAAATGSAIGKSDINLVGSPSIQASGHVSSAKGTGTGSGNFTAGGNASLSYYVEIGSVLNGQLPIKVAATVGVNVKAEEVNADATFTLVDTESNAVVLTATTFDQNGGFHSADVTGDFLNGFKGGTTISPTLFMTVNRIYEVEMVVNASVGIPAPSADGSLQQADALAFVDPYFQLGDGVDPNLYHLLFSPSIQNLPPTSTVPTPGAFDLLGLGLAALGGLRRRKTASSLSPAA